MRRKLRPVYLLLLVLEENEDSRGLCLKILWLMWDYPLNYDPGNCLFSLHTSQGKANFVLSQIILCF